MRATNSFGPTAIIPKTTGPRNNFKSSKTDRYCYEEMVFGHTLAACTRPGDTTCHFLLCPLNRPYHLQQQQQRQQQQKQKTGVTEQKEEKKEKFFHTDRQTDGPIGSTRGPRGLKK